MEDIVITSAVRTPIGSFLGSLSSLTSVELGTIATKEAMKRSKLSGDQIDQVIFGNVLQAGAKQNVARQIEINAGIKVNSTAFTVNQVCGSGLKAVRLAQAAITIGDAEIVIAGGTESMSNAPYVNPNMRSGHKMGEVSLLDTIQVDALNDPFTNVPMGETAEAVAEKFHITRAMQDHYAYRSYQRAINAQDHHLFDAEMVPVEVKTKHGTNKISVDESIRRDTTLDGLSQLKPAFRKNGTVTAGNAASLNDGASAIVLMKASKAKELNIEPIATIHQYTEVGIEPNIMGYGPYDAVKQLLKKENLTIEDIDQFELNEAFAAQTLAVMKDLNIKESQINVTGGAIAMGHPLGDSGSRIIVTLINNLKRAKQHQGIATLCIGGGMGMAMHISIP